MMWCYCRYIFFTKESANVQHATIASVKPMLTIVIRCLSFFPVSTC